MIGKNGVGKTQILSHLAESLSGLTESVSEKEEPFKGKRPPVDKVISISEKEHTGGRPHKAIWPGNII